MKKIILAMLLLCSPVLASADAPSCFVKINFSEYKNSPYYDSLSVKNLFGNFGYLVSEHTFGDAYPAYVNVYNTSNALISHYGFVPHRFIFTELPEGVIEGDSEVNEIVIPSQKDAVRLTIKDARGEVGFPNVDKGVLNCAYSRNSINVAPIPAAGIGAPLTLSWSLNQRSAFDTSLWAVDKQGHPVFTVSLWKVDGTKVEDILPQTTSSHPNTTIPSYLAPGTYYVQVEVVGDPMTAAKSNLFTVTKGVPLPTPSGSPTPLPVPTKAKIVEQTLARQSIVKAAYDKVVTKKTSTPKASSPSPSPTASTTRPTSSNGLWTVISASVYSTLQYLLQKMGI